MSTLGTLALAAACLAILATIVSGVAAARTGTARMERLTHVSALGITTFVTLAVLALQVSLVRLDFGMQYVAEYTSSTLSVPYRIGAMWAGQAGSLLLWGWIIAIGGALTLLTSHRRGLDLSPWVYVLIAAFDGLFIGLVTFLQRPFLPSGQRLQDGVGLNPLLQDPLQLIHPVLLYGGYVLFTVPFAILIGQIIGGRTTGPWISFARLWTIVPWTSLTIGMLLGARWAYAELGWGGYWAWDPVENASLIPWLSGTALLHAGLSQRGDRNRLRMSSVLLLTATFNLCLFGTFLTRSGVIQSVHAFGISNVGPVIGAAIIASVLLTGGVLIWRLPELQRPDVRRRWDGWFGNRVLVTLLVIMTIAVLWGTLYPLFARAFLGQEVAVSPGFFRVVVTPLGVAMLVLLAVSPFLPGQRIDDQRREAIVRVVLFAAVAAATLLMGGQAVVALVLALAVLSIRTIVWRSRPEFAVAFRAGHERPRAIVTALSPYLAHMGLVVLFAAIAINVTGEVRQQVRLNVGSTATVAGHSIRLDSAQVQNLPDRQVLQGQVGLLDTTGALLDEMGVSVSAFRNASAPYTQIGINTSLTRDVYIVIDGWPTDISAGIPWLRLTVYDNPAISWVWFGAGMIGVGGFLQILALAMRDRRPRIPDTPAELIDGVAAEVVVPRPRRGRRLVAAALVVVVGGLAWAGTHQTEPAVASTPTPTAAPALDLVRVGALMQRITADPKDVTAYAQLGALYFNAGSTAASRGDSASATDYFAKATDFFVKRRSLAPGDVTAWLDEGAAALASRQRDRSFQALTRAVAMQPGNQLAHFDLGIWYLNATPAQQALATKEFRTVIGIDATSALGKAAAQRLAGATK